MAWQNTHMLGLGLPYPYLHFVSGLSAGKSIPVHARPSTQERCMRGTGEAGWFKMRCDDGPAISGSRHVWAGSGSAPAAGLVEIVHVTTAAPRQAAGTGLARGGRRAGGGGRPLGERRRGADPDEGQLLGWDGVGISMQSICGLRQWRMLAD